MVILNLYGIAFHAVVVFRREHDFLFKSASSYCDWLISKLQYCNFHNANARISISIMYTTYYFSFFFSGLQSIMYKYRFDLKFIMRLQLCSRNRWIISDKTFINDYLAFIQTNCTNYSFLQNRVLWQIVTHFW